jgi:hypothetical protein
LTDWSSEETTPMNEQVYAACRWPWQHRWGPWGEPFEVNLRRYFRIPAAPSLDTHENYLELHQQRTCLRCGLIQEREIK